MRSIHFDVIAPQAILANFAKLKSTNAFLRRVSTKASASILLVITNVCAQRGTLEDSAR